MILISPVGLPGFYRCNALIGNIGRIRPIGHIKHLFLVPFHDGIAEVAGVVDFNQGETAVFVVIDRRYGRVVQVEFPVVVFFQADGGR